VAGALLVGAGLVLILAHNWDQLARPARAAAAFLPLLATQGLMGWTLWRRPESTALREAGAGLLAAALAACIALISQTYQVPGDVGGFLLTCALLVLPLVYLANATLAALLYLIGVAVWALLPEERAANCLYYYPLAALLLPHALSALHQHPYGPRIRLLGWFGAGSMVVATAGAAAWAGESWWMPTLAAVYGLMAATGGLWRSPEALDALRPFRLAGAGGVWAVSLAATVKSFYDIPLHHAQAPWRLGELGGTGLLLAAGVLALLVGYLRGRRGELAALVYGFCPLAVLVAVAAQQGSEVGWAPVCMNLYPVALGLALLYEGFGRGSAVAVNGGMALLTLLAVVRFLDSDISFVVRGIGFMAVGLCFLAANVVLHRTRKGAVT